MNCNKSYSYSDSMVLLEYDKIISNKTENLVLNRVQ